MTRSKNSPQKPNAPIFLEDICITSINGHCLEEPCAARVVLRLSPTIMPLIESDSFPIEILDHRMKTPFVVTVKDRCDIQVIRSGLRWPGSGSGTARGALALYKSPYTVIQSDAKIRYISFGVLNFLRFLGATELVHEDLRITITEDTNLSANAKLLDKTGGYAVTHIGRIERHDGGIFSVEKAEHILRGLRAFLSFARGAGCGLTLVKAAYPDGREAILEWGSAHTDPWRCSYNTWLTKLDGGDNLSQAFPGFWELYSDPSWRDVLSRTIDWCLNSKSSAIHVGIILVQAALESLCYKTVGPNNEGSMGEFLSKSIGQIGLCTAIPQSCNNLDNFFKNCSRVDGNGPRAITELRNDLVNAKRKYGDSAEAQMDALRLGTWYIELILLKKFGYQGRYINRLAIAEESPFEKVPWAK